MTPSTVPEGKEKSLPIQHAVLALLAEGPSYGYELKTSFEEAIGPQWGELNIGHLYQVLERLVRYELVTRRVVHQTNRPDKTMYRLTTAGRRELEEWLTKPHLRLGGYRDDFFLKLFAAARSGARRMRQVTRVQREACLAELATLGELRARHGRSPLVDLLIEAAVLHTEANLRFLDLIDERRAEIARVSKPTHRDMSHMEEKAITG